MLYVHFIYYNDSGNIQSLIKKNKTCRDGLPLKMFDFFCLCHKRCFFVFLYIYPNSTLSCSSLKLKTEFLWWHAHGHAHTHSHRRTHTLQRWQSTLGVCNQVRFQMHLKYNLLSIHFPLTWHTHTPTQNAILLDQCEAVLNHHLTWRHPF